jgi:EAL domain-containing protein (putative c-di-GMP-specific phosphodiesterase class I)
MGHAKDEAKKVWILRGLGEGGRPWTIQVRRTPFRIGRRPGLDLTLPTESVSNEHAELVRDGQGLRLRDLGSTNGTFVNRERIQEAEVRDGDVLHFAELEFQLGLPESGVQPRRTTAVMPKLPSEARFFQGAGELSELMRLEAVTTVFQPILELPSHEIVGYEALGRGKLPGLPEGPTELFRIAKSIDREVQLADVFRKHALDTACDRSDLPALFLNTHPSEVVRPELLRAVVDATLARCRLKLVIEIHEAAIVEIGHIAELKEKLAVLGVQLAYDDFGSGQARLLELAEVPPDYLKFDIRFIHKIDEALPSKRQLLGSLVTAARELGVHALAEGVETEGEEQVCLDLGFTHAQGYRFSYPVPLEAIQAPSEGPGEE